MEPATAVPVRVGVVALVGFALFPAYWMISSGLDLRAAQRGGSLLPLEPSLDNFAYVLGKAGFAHYLKNSAIVAQAYLSWPRPALATPPRR